MLPNDVQARCPSYTYYWNMTAYLPGPLLKLFTPREHPEWFEQKKDGDDAAAEGDGADGAKKPLSRALEYAPSWDKK